MADTDASPHVREAKWWRTRTRTSSSSGSHSTQALISFGKRRKGRAGWKVVNLHCRALERPTPLVRESVPSHTRSRCLLWSSCQWWDGGMEQCRTQHGTAEKRTQTQVKPLRSVRDLSINPSCNSQSVHRTRSYISDNSRGGKQKTHEKLKKI